MLLLCYHPLESKSLGPEVHGASQPPDWGCARPPAQPPMIVRRDTAGYSNFKQRFWACWISRDNFWWDQDTCIFKNRTDDWTI